MKEKNSTKRGRPLKNKEDKAQKRILVGLTEKESLIAEDIAKKEFDALAQHIRKYYLLGVRKSKNLPKEVRGVISILNLSEGISKELSKVIKKAEQEKGVLHG